MLIDTEFAFNRYQEIRPRLPDATFPEHSAHVGGLLELADDFDVFLFDAFGVLNVGNRCIEGAPAVVSRLQSSGKHTFVVTNAGSLNKQKLLEKYQALGYQFEFDQVVTSRDQMSIGLKQFPASMCWGVAAPVWSTLETIDADLCLLQDEQAVYDRVDGFVLLGAHSWSSSRQALMCKSLNAQKRPILVGNPDLVAPREDGFSLEPGFYAHDIADKTGIEPGFFGKPFGHVFSQIKTQVADLDASRVIMIGDTLHTDILGGAAAGFKTALVTDHGLFKGHKVDNYIERSKIIPDYILPSI